MTREEGWAYAEHLIKTSRRIDLSARPQDQPTHERETVRLIMEARDFILEAYPSAMLPVQIPPSGNADPSPELFLLSLWIRNQAAAHNAAVSSSQQREQRKQRKVEQVPNANRGAVFKWSLYFKDEEEGEEVHVASGTRSCSLRDAADTEFVKVLRDALDEKLDALGRAPIDDAKFSTGRFCVGANFWWESADEELRIVAAPPSHKAPTFRLFPVCGFGRQFMVLSPAGVQDIMRAIDRASKPVGGSAAEQSSRRWVRRVLEAADATLGNLQLANVMPRFVSCWRLYVLFFFLNLLLPVFGTSRAMLLDFANQNPIHGTVRTLLDTSGAMFSNKRHS